MYPAEREVAVTMPDGGEKIWGTANDVAEELRSALAQPVAFGAGKRVPPTEAPQQWTWLPKRRTHTVSTLPSTSWLTAIWSASPFTLAFLVGCQRIWGLGGALISPLSLPPQ